jgi:hypothetical protein
MDKENLGPAERILQSVLNYADHMVHNRPGIVVRDARFNVGVRWEYVTHKVEDGQKVVYKLVKTGKKTTKVKLGLMTEVNQVRADNGTIVGDYREAGIFPEVATWMYRQVADVWKMDNEFAARWASYAFTQDHRDLKVILAAFMLCQTRKGDPVLDEGKVAFYDEDYRDIGEAMLLVQPKTGKHMDAKQLLRIREVLKVPGVAAINRELGFGKSARKPFLGRWNKAVEKWLRYREENPKLLEGLVKSGFRTTVMALAQQVGYKPETPRFFQTLRWKQEQAEGGWRSLAIGEAVKAADTWEGLDERAICERIVKDKPSWRVLTSRVPTSVGITRAIVAAAIEAGGFSDKDLIIATPTLDDLGLLNVPDIRKRWENAGKAAEDMRAANIAARVKSKEVREKLNEIADTANANAVAEVTKNIVLYVIVDRSGSMSQAIELAIRYVSQLLRGFPLDRVHVSHFNSVGVEVTIKHPSKAGVENAFKGVSASGATNYGAGVRVLAHHKPKDDEDTIFLFIGDERNFDSHDRPFDEVVRQSGLRPSAFGLVRVGTMPGVCVQTTAARLGIPCFQIDEKTFDDVYAIPRTLRNLIAATPVNRPIAAAAPAAPRLSLVETVLKTDLLAKPAWAA